MAGENFDEQAIGFADIAEETFPRRLVFERTPKTGEAITDDAGYPSTTYTEIDTVSDSIPCIFVVKSSREVTIANQQRSVTPYSVTIPQLYYTTDDNGDKVLQPVDFSLSYRVRILEDGSNAEIYLQVIGGGGDDPTPDITFTGVRLEELV